MMSLRGGKEPFLMLENLGKSDQILKTFSGGTWLCLNKGRRTRGELGPAVLRGLQELSLKECLRMTRVEEGRRRGDRRTY